MLVIFFPATKCCTDLLNGQRVLDLDFRRRHVEVVGDLTANAEEEPTSVSDALTHAGVEGSVFVHDTAVTCGPVQVNVRGTKRRQKPWQQYTDIGEYSQLFYNLRINERPSMVRNPGRESTTTVCAKNDESYQNNKRAIPNFNRLQLATDYGVRVKR